MAGSAALHRHRLRFYGQGLKGGARPLAGGRLLQESIQLVQEALGVGAARGAGRRETEGAQRIPHHRARRLRIAHHLLEARRRLPGEQALEHGRLRGAARVDPDLDPRARSLERPGGGRSEARGQHHVGHALALAHEGLRLLASGRAQDGEAGAFREARPEVARAVGAVEVDHRDGERRSPLAGAGEDHAEEDGQQQRPAQDEEQVTPVADQQPQVLDREGDDGRHGNPRL